VLLGKALFPLSAPTDAIITRVYSLAWELCRTLDDCLIQESAETCDQLILSKVNNEQI